ncbi:hypothetical protein [Tsukamurella pulmonis]|uniref:hypothetical protein n=1 Tax=Tsukamurella pulmonis TaxID=47312 RepID=UPI000E08FD4B|nr:hypothetical protein [Tsukamurella pulmonis]RDH13755.1 hypothetical protein DVB88_00835 [Tsukamurella pulmonis]
MSENIITRLTSGPGRDVESRAQLYRVVQRGAALANLLDTLPAEAVACIGLTGEDRDRLSQLTSRALWASTADLHQNKADDLARRVTARAAELDAEERS